MTPKIYWNILLLVVLSISCSSLEKLQQPVIVKESHMISITGIVTEINSTNVDKSGKNPRLMIHGMLKIEFYDDGGWDAVLGPEIKFACKEKDLIEQTGKKINRGDRVLITTYITEKSPEVIAVHTIKFP